MTKVANDISLLQETAIVRQKDLKFLPYVSFRETLGMHGITLFPGIQNKHVQTYYERKQGVAKPYVQGNIKESKLGKTKERTLEVQKAYANIVDNITNYKTISVGPDVLLGKNKSKKHPWNVLMISETIKTFSEDILDALFHATYDVEDESPMGLFDGYDTKLNALIASGEISAEEGNLYDCGDLENTAENPTAVYDRLLAFWRTSPEALKKAKTLLRVPSHIADAYDDAYLEKFKHKPIMDEYGRTYLHGTGNKCTIVRSYIMGTGDRIHLSAPGNFDFGMDSDGDRTFVQVRNPFTDPNDIQFWIQADYGTRIGMVHKKVFRINAGTPVATQLSGDYVS